MGTITEFDGEILRWIQEVFVTGWLTPLMKAVTSLAAHGILLVIVCLVLLLFKKTRKLGILCAASLAFTFLCCNLIIKPAVDRPRPWVLFEAVQNMLPPPGDASFPSGHSANSMAVAWAMFINTLPEKVRPGARQSTAPRLGWGDAQADRRTMHIIGIIAVVLALAIGFSRLYLGMHFPTDVISGLLLGMVCATIVYAVNRKLENRKNQIKEGKNENTD